MRTRKGSTTDSIVSASSPTDTARVFKPDRSAVEPGEHDLHHRAVEAIEAELVDVVELERRVAPRRGPRRAPCTSAIVAHPTQQPVGDARCAAAAPGDLGERLAVDVEAEQRRRAREHLLEFAVVVELEVRGEPESVAQRVRQQPRPCRRAHEGERREIQGMDVAPAPLPTMMSMRKSSIAR